MVARHFSPVIFEASTTITILHDSISYYSDPSYLQMPNRHLLHPHTPRPPHRHSSFLPQRQMPLLSWTCLPLIYS